MPVLAANPQQQAEAVEGVWFYELEEMEGLSEQTMEKAKGLVRDPA